VDAQWLGTYKVLDVVDRGTSWSIHSAKNFYWC